jgi:membrane protein
MAAALSYYTLFSLAPLLLVMVAVAGFVFRDPSLVDAAVAEVRSLAGAEVAQAVETLIGIAEDQARASLGIGLGLAAFTASGVFIHVQGVLARVFGVPESRAVGWPGVLWRRLIALVSALVLAVLVFVPLLAVAALRFLVAVLSGDSGGPGAVVGWAILPVSLLLLVWVLGLSYRGLTSAAIDVRAARVGATFTAVTGVGAAWLAGSYLARFATSGTLGALGGLAVLLFVSNLLWQVYLFGAELAKVSARTPAKPGRSR